MKDNYSWLDSLVEQLAAIEHERWASWQSWLHSQLIKTKDGLLMTPEYYEHLEYQIAADYSELTEKEKESDREQVRRYLPILTNQIEIEKLRARIETTKHIIEICEGVIESWSKHAYSMESMANDTLVYSGKAERKHLRRREEDVTDRRAILLTSAIPKHLETELADLQEKLKELEELK